MVWSEVPCCSESLRERGIEGGREVVGSSVGGTDTTV